MGSKCDWRRVASDCATCIACTFRDDGLFACRYEMSNQGIEDAMTAFGAFNGLRIVNLAQRSRFRDYFHTQTIESLVQELDAVTNARGEASAAARK